MVRISTSLGALMVAVALLAGAPAIAAAQSSGIYIIYDSSNSMWGSLPDTSRKYEAARVALRALMERDFGDRQVALRMYGHTRKDDCADTALVVPFGSKQDVSTKIIDTMEAVRPKGRTPIDRSLRAALDDFGDRPGSIILISDGIESCDADPCALVKSWADKQIKISVHVVGLGLKGKERAAMQCIAEAAGTEYRDAFSTGELIETLDAAVQEANAGQGSIQGSPSPVPSESGPDFALVVETNDGVRQNGVGVLTSAVGETIAIESFKRSTPDPGLYSLSAGVRTVDGAAYKPTKIDIAVGETGRTIGRVVAPRPPEARATFAMEGEELRATVVTVFRDGKKLGSFKGDETAFVPEGTLEFRSKLVGTSEPLSVVETFAAGDTKTIAFAAAKEVHLRVIAKGTANGVQLRGKPATELWQNGAQVHKINNTSGSLVTPGEYLLVIDDRLNRFETEIVVSQEPKQVLEIDVPAGGLTVTYMDVAGNEMDPARVFVAPLGAKRGQVRTSGKPMILMPGTYTLTGWPEARGFSDQEITIKAGEARTITLQATK